MRIVCDNHPDRFAEHSPARAQTQAIKQDELPADASPYHSAASEASTPEREPSAAAAIGTAAGQMGPETPVLTTLRTSPPDESGNTTSFAFQSTRITFLETSRCEGTRRHLAATLPRSTVRRINRIAVQEVNRMFTTCAWHVSLWSSNNKIDPRVILTPS